MLVHDLVRSAERLCVAGVFAVPPLGAGHVAAQQNSASVPAISVFAPIQLSDNGGGRVMQGDLSVKAADSLRAGAGQKHPGILFEGVVVARGPSGLPPSGLPPSGLPGDPPLAGAPGLRAVLLHPSLGRVTETSRKPVGRYLVLGAGIGGLSGGLLGWLAGEGMNHGMHGEGRGAHTQTAVAMGVAGGAAFGTLVGLIVYAIDAATSSP